MARPRKSSPLGSLKAMMRRLGSRAPTSTSRDSLMSEPQIKELEVVELAADAGRWPAGTRGTVVETFPSAALIEIADERGHSQDFLTLPYDVLRPLEAHEQKQLAI
jgi:hypothetical protein